MLLLVIETTRAFWVNFLLVISLFRTLLTHLDWKFHIGEKDIYDDTCAKLLSIKTDFWAMGGWGLGHLRRRSGLHGTLGRLILAAQQISDSNADIQTALICIVNVPSHYTYQDHVDGKNQRYHSLRCRSTIEPYSQALIYFCQAWLIV